MTKRQACALVGVLLVMCALTPLVSVYVGDRAAGAVFTTLFLVFCYWPVGRRRHERP